MPGTRRSLNGERVELRVLQTFTVAEPCAPEQFVHSINLPLSLLHFCSWGSKREILCFQVVGGNMLPSADGIPGDHLGAVFAAVPYLFVPMYFGGGRRERVSAPLPRTLRICIHFLEEPFHSSRLTDDGQRQMLGPNPLIRNDFLATFQHKRVKTSFKAFLKVLALK